jgi:hypothetical protein
MSRLAYWGRPWVVFDATNKQHRRWFAEFQKYHTWGHCPVRFVVDEQGELLSSIQQQLIEYYVSKEFKERNESKEIRPQRKPRKKHVPA